MDDLQKMKRAGLSDAQLVEQAERYIRYLKMQISRVNGEAYKLRIKVASLEAKLKRAKSL